ERYKSRGSDQIRIVMEQWSWETYGQKKIKKFSISPWELKQALKEAGLYETVEVPGDDRKALEIAMYHALCAIEAGPNRALSDTGKKARDRLWTRITRYLDL